MTLEKITNLANGFPTGRNSVISSAARLLGRSATSAPSHFSGCTVGSRPALKALIAVWRRVMSAVGQYLYSSRKNHHCSRRTIASSVSKSTGFASKGAVPGGSSDVAYGIGSTTSKTTDIRNLREGSNWGATGHGRANGSGSRRARQTSRG